MSKLTLVGYFILITSFCVFSYLFIDPNFFYLSFLFSGIAFTKRIEVGILYSIFIFLFFSFYLYFLSYFKKNNKIKTLKIIIAITSFLLLSYPTIISYDIFNYITTSKVAFYFHENPYAVMPNEFLNDTNLLFTRASNKYAIYGPSWLILSGIPYLLSFGNVLLSILLFKIFVGIFYLGIVILIYKLSKKNVYITAFFALNPLVIIETFVSGHNDSVMMFFALLSFYLSTKKKLFSSLCSLTVSVLVKYSTIILVPVLFLFHFDRLRKESGNSKLWQFSFFGMLVLFLLSPLREEMYPWYAIWILPFIALLENKKIMYGSIAFSFGLMLYYVPYMITGQYLGYSYVLKYVLVFLPLLFSIPFIVKKEV